MRSFPGTVSSGRLHTGSQLLDFPASRERSDTSLPRAYGPDKEVPAPLSSIPGAPSVVSLQNICPISCPHPAPTVPAAGPGQWLSLTHTFMPLSHGLWRVTSKRYGTHWVRGTAARGGAWPGETGRAFQGPFPGRQTVTWTASHCPTASPILSPCWLALQGGRPGQCPCHSSLCPICS